VIFPSSPSLIPALRLFLVNKLQKALQLQYGIFREINSLDYPEADYLRQQSLLLLRAISLNSNHSNGQICYTSAIALRLANQWECATSEVASAIYQTLSHVLKNLAGDSSWTPMDEISEYFVPQIFSSGWLSLSLNHQGLAKWLEILIHHPLKLGNSEGSLQTQPNQVINNSDRLFAIQYAHARCYSLLRLAQRAEILELSNLDDSKSPKSFFLPCSKIPWLNHTHELRISHAAEQGLITQLVSTVDDLFCLEAQASQTLGLKLAYALSQQFQKFYSACPIWGDAVGATSGSALDLVKVRLGLILITQSVLRSLLQDVIGAIAPEEL
jgi:hypothetical protein